MKSSRLIVPILLALLAGPATAASHLVVPEATWSAGVVTKGEVVRHVFVVRNDGTTDLHLTEVRPSCGCTAAEYDRVIGPGQQGRITLVVETKGFQGSISKRALVLSDDPAAPQTSLLVSATVKTVVDILPSGFLRVQAFGGEKASAEVTVVSDDPGFSPAVAEAPQPWASVAVAPVPEREHLPNRGPRQFRVRLTVGEGAPEGLIGGALKLSTGIEKLPFLEIPLSGFIRPTISVSAGRVSFQNFVLEGEPIRRTVLLTNQNPKNERFTVTDAISSVAGIVTEVIPLDRQKVQIVMTVDARIRKGPFDGTLTVKTNDPLKSEIRLPISGTVLIRAAENPPKG